MKQGIIIDGGTDTKYLIYWQAYLYRKCQDNVYVKWEYWSIM